MTGDAPNKQKDAREKTSGLANIGLIDANRKATAAGRELLEISQKNDFDSDNLFRIPKDSFIYLRQLLKTSCLVDGATVRPFIILLYFLSELNYLTFDEFTYLLPLCTNDYESEQILTGIRRMRNGEISIDAIIIDRLMRMDNYQAALQLFLENEVDEKLICETGLNRKSRNYDRPYLELYNTLFNLFVRHDETAILHVFQATRKITLGRWWREFFFKTASESTIKNNPRKHLKSTNFGRISSIAEFKELFFITRHLIKAKATLSDYQDLNRRYIKLTDVILFEDSVIKLDIVPKHFFKSIIVDLYADAYSPSEILGENCGLEEIAPCLTIDTAIILNSINAELGLNLTTIEDAFDVLEDARYKKFHHLVDSKFTDENILQLLECFENRKDDEIYSRVTDNADIPTIFEYVLGILWYKISEQKGKILDYMKLSLDADLLPKSHAVGGEADIVYEYDETDTYPNHTLLIEATLTDATNQRRIEMEPVSRHLGQFLIRTKNPDSYCVFITNVLNINVISDFRSRKTTPYYDSQDFSRCVSGMKIIPLQTQNLKNIIRTHKKYKELYLIFEDAFQSSSPPHEWFATCIDSAL